MATTLKINANRLKIIRNPLPAPNHTAPSQAFSSRATDV
jgi:hypothetical protein